MGVSKTIHLIATSIYLGEGVWNQDTQAKMPIEWLMSKVRTKCQ